MPHREESSLFYLSSTEHFSISSQLVALPSWFSLTDLTSLVSSCDRMEQSTLFGKCFYKLVFFKQWRSPTQNDRLQAAQKTTNVFFWYHFIELNDFQHFITGLLAHVFCKAYPSWTSAADVPWKAVLNSPVYSICGDSLHTCHTCWWEHIWHDSSRKDWCYKHKEKTVLSIQRLCVIYCLCFAHVCKSAFDWTVLTLHTVAVYFIVRRASLKDLAMFTCLHQSKSRKSFCLEQLWIQIVDVSIRHGAYGVLNAVGCKLASKSLTFCC